MSKGRRVSLLHVVYVWKEAESRAVEPSVEKPDAWHLLCAEAIDGVLSA